MAKQTIAIIAAVWIVFAPITAYWIMWEFAFGSIEDYYLGNTLISIVLIGPPVIIAIICFISRAKLRD